MSDRSTLHPIVDDVPEEISVKPADGHAPLPASGPFPARQPPDAYRLSVANRRVILGSIFATLLAITLIVFGQDILFARPDERDQETKSRFVIPASPAFSATPSATPKAAATKGASSLAFLEPAVTPTPVPGGRLLVLTPALPDTGWVVSDDESVVTSYDPQNHFGDSYLYAGVLAGKVYHAAIQFDLGRIPRGTKIYAARLRLTGLRADQLEEGGRGVWRLEFLSSEIDYNWRSHNYEQIQSAATWSTFEPPLSQEQLGEGRANVFEFTPEQLALLERRIFEGNDEFGRWVSFRLDGPAEGNDNLFAWDSGYGPVSQGSTPQLFLSLGPPPLEPPPPYYVIITSTPTPENIMTAAANSLQMTAEAVRLGTATPLPPNWVTPVVVTATPTAENQATAQAMGELATAIALTTGIPPNMVTATPTPTPQDIMTPTLNVPQATAEPVQLATATLLPANEVTPPVVTNTATVTSSVTPTPTLGVLTGTLTLLSPVTVGDTTYGPTDFRWRWSGAVPAGVGFEVRVWREGEEPVGAHNAVLDNQNGNIKRVGENEYLLSTDIREAAGIRGRSGEYLWTVALVQIAPDYMDLELQASPARLGFETPSGNSDNDSNASGSGVGVN